MVVPPHRQGVPMNPLILVADVAAISVLTFGSYFAYDAIGALSPNLIQAWQTTRESIGSLYTIYSVAAVLSVFVGGVLIDKIGTRIASLLFSALIVIGAAIVALAPSVTVDLPMRPATGE